MPKDTVLGGDTWSEYAYHPPAEDDRYPIVFEVRDLERFERLELQTQFNDVAKLWPKDYSQAVLDEDSEASKSLGERLVAFFLAKATAARELAPNVRLISGVNRHDGEPIVSSDEVVAQLFDKYPACMSAVYRRALGIFEEDADAESLGEAQSAGTDSSANTHESLAAGNGVELNTESPLMLVSVPRAMGASTSS